MSVFKKLKGSIQKSQQELVNGIKTLTSFDGYLRHEQLQHIRSKDINLNVGADLLNSYQETWSVIQNETKECSSAAERAAAGLDPLVTLWDRKLKVISRLEEEVVHIPGTVSSLKEMQALIGTIRQDFAIVEKSLDMLENLCEEQDLKKAMAEEQMKLAHYSAIKMAKAEKVKVDLALSHARQMTKLESSKRINLQERAEAFTSAFKEDVEYYKTHGHPDIHVMPTEFPKVSSLSEIEIDEDKKALDSFLGPLQQDNPAETDEPYFEDDYTSDYSIKQDDDFIDENDINPLFPDDVYCVNEDDTDTASAEEDRLSQEDTSVAQKASLNTETDKEPKSDSEDILNTEMKAEVNEVESDDKSNESKLHSNEVNESSAPS